MSEPTPAECDEMLAQLGCPDDPEPDDSKPPREPVMGMAHPLDGHKTLVKLRKNTKAFTEACSHAKGSASFTVSDRKITADPATVEQALRDIRFKNSVSTRRANGSFNGHSLRPEIWDDFLSQIQNVCSAIEECPVHYLDWEALLGRIGHGEVIGWISAWRKEVACRRQKTLKQQQQKKPKLDADGKPLPQRTPYDFVMSTLKLQNHLFVNNMKVCIAALDQSSGHESTAYVALNILIKRVQIWLPVFIE